MKIEVTQKHIERSKKLGDTKLASESCPIALAVKDKIHRWVGVGIRTIEYKTSSGKMTSKRLPEKASQFIKSFDIHCNDNKKTCPKPITFELK